MPSGLLALPQEADLLRRAYPANGPSTLAKAGSDGLSVRKSIWVFNRCFFLSAGARLLPLVNEGVSAATILMNPDRLQLGRGAVQVLKRGEPK